MHWDVKLNNPFSYTKIGFLILLIIIIITLVIFIIKHVRFTPQNQVVEEPKKDIPKIKKEYLTRIDNLVSKINNQGITNRKAYNELSVIIREFIFKTTDINVLKYTLAEAKRTKNKELIELLTEYYEPEFSKEGKGNIFSSIDKTRKVIIEWK